MVNTPKPVSSEASDVQQSMQKLKQNSGYIIGAITVALVGYFGWSYIQNSHMSTDTVAADKYAVIEQTEESLQLANDATTSVDDKTINKMNADIDALVAEHGTSVYAWQALMLKARRAADANDLALAADALKKALDVKIKDAGLHAITQLRYAAVLLEKGDIDEAMTQVSVDVPSPFEASQQEILGDIYIAKGDKQSAMRSYENAWSLISKRGEERSVLRLKLESLGVNPTPIEQPPQVVNQVPHSNAAALMNGMNQVNETNGDSSSSSNTPTADDADAKTASSSEKDNSAKDTSAKDNATKNDAAKNNETTTATVADSTSTNSAKQSNSATKKEVIAETNKDTNKDAKKDTSEKNTTE